MTSDANDKPVLIAAWGNTLRGDDGVGPAVADHLQQHLSDPRIQFAVMHQPVPELAEPISRAGLVIFIDAACHGQPGEIRIQSIEPGDGSTATTQAVTHHWGPAALLFLAQQVYGQAPPGWVCSVTAKSFEHGESLTPAVKEAVERLVIYISELVQSFLKGGSHGCENGESGREDISSSLATGEDDRRPP